MLHLLLKTVTNIRINNSSKTYNLKTTITYYVFLSILCFFYLVISTFFLFSVKKTGDTTKENKVTLDWRHDFMVQWRHYSSVAWSNISYGSFGYWTVFKFKFFFFYFIFLTIIIWFFQSGGIQLFLIRSAETFRQKSFVVHKKDPFLLT